ncbi:MAG: glycosyltransferase family 4 protein [Polyangia bacterium]
MRLFYLTTEFLWPPHQGGRVRSLAQLKLLAAQPEVTALTIFSLTEVAVTPAEIEALSQAVLGARPAQLPPLQLRVVPPPRHPIHLKQAPGELLRVLGRRLRDGTPYLLGKWQSAAVTATLRGELQAGYDVVYIDHLGMAVYLPVLREALPHARLVLEEHNVESDFFRQFAARPTLLPPLRPLARLEHRAAARAEAHVLDEVDAVVTISGQDALDLVALHRRLGRRDRAVHAVPVPQVMETSRPSRPPPPTGEPPRLCYVGSLSWHPNVLGLDWFCQKVWPHVQALRPDARLTIAGSGLAAGPDGRPRVPVTWQVPGVDVVGYVPDLEALYQRALAAIAPVLGGSGVRIKLLESLRAGLPTVTTSAGAAGLPLTPGREVLIEDDPRRFAQAAARLLTDPPLREALRQGGYKFLEEHHSRARATEALRRALIL